MNLSGEGRDAFKALEGSAVLYFQVQVLAHFLGEVTGEMRTRQNMSLPGPHPQSGISFILHPGKKPMGGGGFAPGLSGSELPGGPGPVRDQAL